MLNFPRGGVCEGLRQTGPGLVDHVGQDGHLFHVRSVLDDLLLGVGQFKALLLQAVIGPIQGLSKLGRIFDHLGRVNTDTAGHTGRVVPKGPHHSLKGVRVFQVGPQFGGAGDVRFVAEGGLPLQFGRSGPDGVEGRFVHAGAFHDDGQLDFRCVLGVEQFKCLLNTPDDL